MKLSSLEVKCLNAIQRLLREQAQMLQKAYRANNPTGINRKAKK